MIFAYLLLGLAIGSIPFGYLIAKAKGVDILSVGSGNIGATNVFRVLGKGPAIVVFLLDVLKGLTPALLARFNAPFELGGVTIGAQEAAFACGFAAILGHSFSPFLKFKGGKGIATGLGMLLGSTPLVACSAFAVFFFFMAGTLFVSLSSIMSGFTTPIAGILLKDSPALLYAYTFLALYILGRHRANVGRLRSGTEPKFGQKLGEARPPNEKSRIGFLLAGLAVFAPVIYWISQ